MGQRGPVPKRSDQRIRRNDYGTIDTVTAIGPVETPELEMPDADQMVVDFYDSLKDSAQAQYYEPSDWQYARLCMRVMDNFLKNPRMSAQLLASMNQMLNCLLVSEGDRRRVQLEIERHRVEGDVVDVAELFRQRLSR